MIKSTVMPKTGNVLIKADSIFSSFKKLKGDKYLLIRNGIIEDISDIRPFHHHLQQLDFTGLSIAPLFCDYHLHFPGSVLMSSQKIAEDLLTHGIHKVYEGGDSNLSGIKMKELLREGIEVKTSGHAVYRKNMYGKFIGKGVDGLSEAREVINYLCEEGVDYLKLVNSGVFKADTAEISSGGFVHDELKEIIRYAKERGLDVFCHANGDRQISDAVSAGASCIIHGLNVSDETLSMMAEKSVAFIPTVNAFSALSLTTTDRNTLANIERAVDAHLFTVRKAADKGVKILPGSDSGPKIIPYGKAYQGELQLFKTAGISTENIISSACADTLNAGIRADFLVLDGLEIKKVFLSGECFYSE